VIKERRLIGGACDKWGGDLRCVQADDWFWTKKKKKIFLEAGTGAAMFLGRGRSMITDSDV